jgi:hypothetical protein
MGTCKKVVIKRNRSYIEFYYGPRWCNINGPAINSSRYLCWFLDGRMLAKIHKGRR